MSDDKSQTVGQIQSLLEASQGAEPFRKLGCTDARFNLPANLPHGESVFIASSRLGRDLAAYPSWFDALRTIAVDLVRQDKFVITAEGTTTHRFVKRLCQLFAIPLLVFRPRFGDQQAKEGRHAESSLVQSIDVNFGERAARDISGLIDDLLIRTAIDVRALAVRKNGNVHAAILKRLDADPAGTRLLVDSRLTTKRTSDELLSAGATAWWLFSNAPANCDSTPQEAETPKWKAPIIDASEINSDGFLLHWTRANRGPWPQQSQHEWIDRLLFSQSRRAAEPCTTLCRILATEKIIASQDLIRGGQPVVCFTSIPLKEVIERRVFRNHLGRWDFEPYGIGIECSSLKSRQQTLRQVIYGDDQTWENLGSTDRPFFQQATSRDGKIDWRQEREWRTLGDVDLRTMDAQSAFVFVPTHAEAEIVATLSRWPVVVLPPKT